MVKKTDTKEEPKPNDVPQGKEDTFGKSSAPIELEVISNGSSDKSKRNRPMGRPTRLDDEMLRKTVDYYDTCRSTSHMPLLEELAIMILDMPSELISRWANRANDKEWRAKKIEAGHEDIVERHEHFSQTIKKLSDLQLAHLKKGGLRDQRNSVAIFLMKANHGMVETNRTELSGPNGQPIEVRPITIMQLKDRDKARIAAERVDDDDPELDDIDYAD